MKKILSAIFITIPALIILAILAFVPSSNFTQLQKDDGFVIENYSVTMQVNEDNSIDVQENITAYFSLSSRGLVRNLPLQGYVSNVDEKGNVKTEIYDYTISNLKVEESENVYLVDSEEYGDYLVLYIGNSSYQSDFTENYSLSYTISLGDDRDGSKDSFYYNVLGSGWTTEIEEFSYQITFPDKTDLTGQEYFVYVGAYGEDGTGTKLTFEGNTISGQYSDLEYGTAVTVQTFFEQGYFNVPYNYTTDAIFLVIALILLVIGIIVVWRNRKKNRVIEVVEFSAPDGITPTEAGFLIDGCVQNKDLTALIVYWASKGYLKIEEKDKDVVLTKLKDLPENATTHEKKFFAGIFASEQKEVLVSSLGNTTAVAGNSAKVQVESRFKQFFVDNMKILSFVAVLVYIAIMAFAVKLGLQTNSELNIFYKFLFAWSMLIGVLCYAIYDKNKGNLSKVKKVLCLIFFTLFYIAGFVGYNFFFQYFPYDPFGTRFILSLSLLLTCIGFSLVEKYTKEGALMLGRVRGLRKYILLTEKKKMEMQVEENPKLFYDILPYAYALGVSDVYMEKFEDIKATLEQTSDIGINIAGILLASHLLNARFAAIGMIATRSLLTTVIGTAIKYGASGKFGGRGFGGGGGFSGGGHGGGGGGRF